MCLVYTNMELKDRYVKNTTQGAKPSGSTPNYNHFNKMPKRDPVTGEEEYDFVAHRPPHKPTNILESTGHLVKGCLGGGILGVQEAYMKCGIWTALIANIFFGVYITYCVHILVVSAQRLYVRLKIPEMSYPDLAEKSIESCGFPKLKRFGKPFRYAVDLIICIDLFGSCCVYEIIIAKTIVELLNEGQSTRNELRMYIVALLIPILLLCMIRSLKYLAPFTLVADFFLVMCVLATVVYSLQISPNISERPAWKSFMGFFEFCGVVTFSMEGIGVSLPIENNMREPRKYPIVLVGGMIIVVGFVILTGFFGYWGWGEDIKTPVTLNFPNDIFPTTLKALIAVMIYITFGLNFWAPFNLVWYYLKKRHPEEKHYIWERVYRAGIIICITIIAVAFPNMGNLMGLIGSFCLSNMGFIFPAIIETLVIWERPGLGAGKWRLWKNFFILLLGVGLLISGTYSNGTALIKDLTS